MHAPGISHVLIFWSTFPFVHDFFLILPDSGRIAGIGAEEARVPSLCTNEILKVIYLNFKSLKF